MRRFAPKLTAALLTFALGVLIVTVRSDPRLREALWTFYGRIVPTADKVQRVEGCYAKWANAADSNQPLGWDLTYYSVITKMRLCTRSALCEQWAKPAPPIQKHISEWQGDPIISSIEIEVPDGHASMAALWFIRTKDQAYYWGFHPLDKDYSGDKHVIPTQDYDTVFKKISCWLQLEPEQQTFGSHGYIGFLSMYKEGKSRQMLLTYEDFIEGGKHPDDGDIRPGPFSRVLNPLVSSLKDN
jgi:hypothetical protein